MLILSVVSSSCVCALFNSHLLHLSLFSSLLPITHLACPTQLNEILKFGMDKLLSSDESSVQDIKLEKILGLSRNSQWVDDEDLTPFKEEDEEEENDSDGQSMF